MAINITTWRPDTCDCEIEYSWDSEMPQEERVHTGKAIKHCASHQHLKQKTAHESFSAILAENQNKNKTHGHIIENFPEVVEIIIQQDGSQTKQLKNSAEFKWSFDEKRNLQISITGLTAQRKGELGALLAKNAIPVQVK